MFTVVVDLPPLPDQPLRGRAAGRRLGGRELRGLALQVMIMIMMKMMIIVMMMMMMIMIMIMMIMMMMIMIMMMMMMMMIIMMRGELVETQEATHRQLQHPQT